MDLSDLLVPIDDRVKGPQESRINFIRTGSNLGSVRW